MAARKRTRTAVTRKAPAKKTARTTAGVKKASKRKSASKVLAQEKVERALHERKAGTLRSGSGKKVTSRKQAIAIGLSEARKLGARIPRLDEG